MTFFVVALCLGISALYELIEWWVALLSEEAADSFLGTQGYVWDTQSDMALALRRRHPRDCPARWAARSADRETRRENAAENGRRIYRDRRLLLSSKSASAEECVVLLHGMIRTPASMETMEEALIEAGYRTANVGYPSREYPIERLAQMAIGQGLARCRSVTGVERIHFVTHSLGGILVRQYLDEGEIPNSGASSCSDRRIRAVQQPTRCETCPATNG